MGYEPLKLIQQLSPSAPARARSSGGSPAPTSHGPGGLWGTQPRRAGATGLLPLIPGSPLPSPRPPPPRPRRDAARPGRRRSRPASPDGGSGSRPATPRAPALRPGVSSGRGRRLRGAGRRFRFPAGAPGSSPALPFGHSRDGAAEPGHAGRLPGGASRCPARPRRPREPRPGPAQGMAGATLRAPRRPTPPRGSCGDSAPRLRGCEGQRRLAERGERFTRDEGKPPSSPLAPKAATQAGPALRRCRPGPALRR